MADTQEQLLTEITTAGVGDFIRLVDNPTGTPVSANIKKENLVDGLFGDTLSPAAISGTNNNYAPVGLATAHLLRLTASSFAVITGMGATAAGRVVILHNIGSFGIGIVNEDPNSSSAFRFSLPYPSVVIPGNGVVILQYDIVSSRWRILNGVGLREKIGADRTYYVRTDGNDANNGLSNSSTGAFLTIQAAINKLGTIDFGTFNVIIQIADGTYTGAVTVGPWIGSGTLTIQGNLSTPANVVISTASDAFSISGVIPSSVTIKDLTIQTTVGNGIIHSGAGIVQWGNIRFGAVANFQIYANGVSSYLRCISNYSIIGNATAHAVATAGGYIEVSSKTVTLTTPTFSFVFTYATRISTVLFQSVTFSGTATGTRYSVDSNGVIYTAGGGATYFPGTVAGTTATGGQYL